ncbi:hypothetical protein NDU88_004495 [Pleurodeles waltl]|uniref:Uncharacterized protein n=1 Tax=Pleurodeles waltl TaxID=8319 RepID=A0AAV7RLQ9_PLEWA|nr:hypothetical protein NDU88_004495 [Pleurodeles waltl]
MTAARGTPNTGAADARGLLAHARRVGRQGRGVESPLLELGIRLEDALVGGGRGAVSERAPRMSRGLCVDWLLRPAGDRPAYAVLPPPWREILGSPAAGGGV